LLGLLLFAAAAGSISNGTLLGFLQSDAPGKDSQQILTFAQRVAYQRAIEEVYWRHRIWPKERPDPKPSLDAVMSQVQLEKKVTDYLRNSQELEDYWQRPITAEQLQAEMDRMAQHTKQPEVLHELFEALGNDPLVIAECLARPVLAERKLSLLASRKDAPQASVSRAENRAPVSGVRYRVPSISDRPNGCIDETWTATRNLNAPSARDLHTAVWTGSEIIVWGGSDGNYFNTGRRYDPATDMWIATSTINAPAGRFGHTAVWTGTEMIVWGGFGGDPSDLNTGGRYDPGNDSWIPTSTSNAPSARFAHTAVWTGNEMIVWGGSNNGNAFNTGARYNPNSDSWTATSTTSAPQARFYHTAIWSGSEMIVWGGYTTPPGNTVNTGWRYNPATDNWTATTTINAPSGRNDHTAVWTDSEMIVWGGIDIMSNRFNTGGRYDPSIDNWTPTAIANAPEARADHTAVWTGSEMIVWGGYDGNTYFDTGGKYNPGTNSWTATSTTNAPDGRSYHTAVWTGDQMIVLGGVGRFGVKNTGGRYCVLYGPTPTPTASPTQTATATPPLVYEAWVARYTDPSPLSGVDIPKALAVDTKGNVCVTGSTYANSITDYATVKYNNSGQQQWVASYHGPGNYGVANAIAVDTAGNVYVTGGIAMCQNHPAWATIKYDSAGQQQWVATYDGDQANAIAVDGSGNVYATGASGGAYTTIKYDGSGQEQWVAQGPSGSAGGIKVDSAGNVYVTGASNGLYTTIKYDTSGQQQWATLGLSGGPAGMAIDSLGNVYVTGTTTGPGGNDDYGTVKYNSSGQEQWFATYNGPGNNSDRAQGIAIDGSGNVYVTGASFGVKTLFDYATVKYNSLGEQQWVARHDGDVFGDTANAIAVDVSNNVYVTGFVTIKYNQAGQEDWVIRYETVGDSSDYGIAIAVDNIGNVYVTGVGAGLTTNLDYVTIKYGQGPPPTPTPTVTASPSPTATVTPTATPTASPTPMPACSPTPTTPPPTPTATATAASSQTPGGTPVSTPTNTPTATPTPTARPNITPRTRPTPPPRP